MKIEKSNPEIKAVAFDIDGTLYPNYRLYIKMVFYFLKNLKFFLHYNKVRKILHRTAVLADFFEYQGRLLAEELDKEHENKAAQAKKKSTKD